jgi:Zn finger protein HypA/HybF involved in hydrogenase expression
MKTLVQQVDYFNQHPAHCLSEFAVQPDSLADIEFDGHGFSGRCPDGLVENPNIVFRVKCRCGGAQHIIVAESAASEISYYQSLVLADRYYLKCATCGKQPLLFNPALHGYNAELMQMEGVTDDDAGASNGTESNRPSTTANAECGCTNCGSHNLEVFTRFEYPSDLFEDAAFADREQEFFSWFTVVGKCPECSTLNTLVDFECA